MSISSTDLRIAASIVRRDGYAALADRIDSEADRIDSALSERSAPFVLSDEDRHRIRHIKSVEGTIDAIKELRELFPNRSLGACMEYVVRRL